MYIQTKATGEILLEEVFKHLGLEETDYFGLQFIDRKQNVVSFAIADLCKELVPTLFTLPTVNVCVAMCPQLCAGCVFQTLAN